MGLITFCVFIGWKYMPEASDAENTTETTNRARIVNLTDGSILFEYGQKEQFINDGYKVDRTIHLKMFENPKLHGKEIWGSGVLILVDNNSKMLRIITYNERLECEYLRDVPYSMLLGCEVYENNVSTGSIGRSIVGGVLFGGVGAIVGATTKAGDISSMNLFIYLNDILDPDIKFELLRKDGAIKKIKYTSVEYRVLSGFCAQVTALTKAIIAQNESTGGVIKL